MVPKVHLDLSKLCMQVVQSHGLELVHLVSNQIEARNDFVLKLLLLVCEVVFSLFELPQAFFQFFLSRKHLLFDRRIEVGPHLL